jgi:hypothetical protein
MVFAFSEGHFDPTVVVCGNHFNLAAAIADSVHRDATFQTLQGCLRGNSRKFGQVDFGAFAGRSTELLRQFSIVGQQQNALGIHVEPAHRKHPGPHCRRQ